MRYYLITENSTQWVTCIVVVDDKNKPGPLLEVDSRIDGGFLKDIFSREIHFSDRVFHDHHYYGWTISKTEYEKICRLVELYPKYQEYLKVLNS